MSWHLATGSMKLCFTIASRSRRCSIQGPFGAIKNVRLVRLCCYADQSRKRLLYQDPTFLLTERAARIIPACSHRFLWLSPEPGRLPSLKCLLLVVSPLGLDPGHAAQAAGPVQGREAEASGPLRRVGAARDGPVRGGHVRPDQGTAGGLPEGGHQVARLRRGAGKRKAIGVRVGSRCNCRAGCRVDGSVERKEPQV
jgi:hypothetical protein